MTRQTAATPATQGSGCLSFTLPPLAVVAVSAVLALFALKSTPTDWLPTSRAISPIFTPEIQYWAVSISQWAAAAQLDPNLVATVMQIESCGDPRARSKAGAIGLFQVMPYHFFALDDPYRPEVNATRGLTYLKRALDAANGDIRLTLAGYNGGIGIITRTEWSWSAETKRYVQYGAPIYSDARSGSLSRNAVTEWYVTYGKSLCAQASRRLGLQ